MAEMYLTDKLLAHQEAASVSPSSPGHGFGSVSSSADSHVPPFNLEDATLQSDGGQISDGEDGYVHYLCRSHYWYCSYV